MTITPLIRWRKPMPMLALACVLCGAEVAHADVVTEWNERAGEIVASSGLLTQPANRVMAITHTAAFEAANAITRRYPSAGAA
jgi:hypothetical protein